MPELAEVEAYRRMMGELVGRRAVAVDAPDAWYVKGGAGPAEVVSAVQGRILTGLRRIGKLALLDFGPARRREGGMVLGLRFGMSGRVLLDGVPGVRGMLYSSERDDPAWDRFSITFSPAGHLVVRDPRRLGGVVLDPDESRLGPDALSVTLGQLGRALGASSAPLKARLLDQSRLAGVGNLAADEILWRAALDPRRPAASLAPPELRRLHRHLRSTLARLIEQGGSHTGELQPERHPDGRCPADGTPLVRATVGGRTTWFCPRHQV